MSTRAKGVDVSHWKPVKDWPALVASGVRFVGMKATEGNSYVDDTLRNHIRGFRTSLLPLGVYYHFPRPGSAKAQAERLVNTIGTLGMGPLQANERLALDVEGSGPTENPKDAIGWIDEFAKTIFELTKRFPIIYTSKRVWRALGNPSWELAPQIDLWLARYNTKLEPELPTPWFNVPGEMGATQVFGHGTFSPAKAKANVAAGTITFTYSDGRNTTTFKLSEEGLLWRRTTPAWVMWQWTDGTNPEHITPGVGKCDANWFRGDDAALQAYVAAPQR